MEGSRSGSEAAMTDYETSHDWARFLTAIFAAYPKPAKNVSRLANVSESQQACNNTVH